MPIKKTYMTIGEVAKYLDIGPYRVRSWTTRGYLNFPTPKLCECGVTRLWEETAIKHWRFKMLTKAIAKRRKSMQWTVARRFNFV